MQAEADAAALLQLIVKAAVSEVEGAEHAGISLVSKDKITTPAGTSDLVREVDEVQYRVGDGPCLRSLRDEVTVRSDDLRDEPRWPRFAKAAVDRGVRSMLSVQLFVDGEELATTGELPDLPE